MVISQKDLKKKKLPLEGYWKRATDGLERRIIENTAAIIDIGIILLHLPYWSLEIARGKNPKEESSVYDETKRQTEKGS